MQKRLLILHGWGGSDYPHWQSYLAAEVAKAYGCVSFFAFSNPHMPELGMWKRELKSHLETFLPDVVVCHSLANTLWFHLANEGLACGVSKLYMVAPPALNTSIKELASFFPLDAPKDLYAKSALLITSSNDPYLTQDEAFALQKSLGVEMMHLEGAGHINTQSGFGMWEWMVAKIKEDLELPHAKM